MYGLYTIHYIQPGAPASGSSIPPEPAHPSITTMAVMVRASRQGWSATTYEYKYDYDYDQLPGPGWADREGRTRGDAHPSTLEPATHRLVLFFFFPSFVLLLRCRANDGGPPIAAVVTFYK